ncbi:hypothetical protein OSB04_025964 [Centaurea solstitialis]|uniref:Cytochrome P450 n=1 Tax=Centaurea solstitialis TaxID=347529 RepID=A0AA38W4G2_9ASTR|nr:hypothetical protein OSB04_025964 [Centaurea solstitialis]
MSLGTITLGEIFILILLPLPLLYFFFRLITNSSKRPPLPPGPYPWPIVGNLFQIRNNAHIRLSEMAQLYGPLMSLRLGQRTVIVGSTSAAAQELLKTHDQVLSGRNVSPFLHHKEPTVMNKNLVFSIEADEGYRHLRNLYTSKLFSTRALESRAKMREEKVMEMMKYIGSKNGESLDIWDLMFVNVVNILGNTLLSMDLLDFEGNGIGACLKGSIRKIVAVALTPQLADLYPILGRWDFEKCYKKVMYIIEEELGGIWMDSLQRKQNGSNLSSDLQDFTDILIQKGFTNQQINYVMEELFTAGTDSMTLTLGSFFVELFENQEVMRKARDEVTKKIDGNVVHESDLVHLPYLEACLKETLRLHPPAPLLLPHRATEACEIMGYTIPKDSQIWLNVWAIARDPTIWDDPLEFKPERFIGSNFNYKGKDFEFLPFGSGRRMCPGESMATKTLLLTLASLILNFDWFLPNTNAYQRSLQFFKVPHSLIKPKLTKWIMNLAMITLGEILILILLPLPLLYFFFRLITNSPKRPPLPPGPFPWPIVGSLFQIKTNAHIRISEMARLHGPLMSLRLGHRTVIVGSSPAAARELLKTHDHVLSGRNVSPLLHHNKQTVYNMNLNFSSDDNYRPLRNIYTSKLFSTRALESRVKTREDKVMEMVKYIGSKNGEEDVNIRDLMFVTAVNILGNTLLSMDLVDFEGNGIGPGVKDSVRRIATLALTPQLADLYPILSRWDFGNWCKQIVYIIEEELGSIWKDSLQRKRNGSNVSSDLQDFSDILIEKGFTNQQINAILEELLTAGTDTMTLITEWFVTELLKNQEVMRKARNEVMEKIDGNVVKETDLVHLPILEACLKETLRLHPPAPLLLPHRAIEACEIMGYTIPKDSQIWVNVWAIGRDPEIWDDPLDFKPERFIGSKLNYKGKDFEFLPFGSGRRMCPGEAMASKTILLSVASLILNFDWFLPNMNAPKEPLQVTFKVRE